MPFLFVHLPLAAEVPPSPAGELRDVLVRELGLEERKRHVFVQCRSPEEQAFPSDRDPRSVFVHLLMYPGRTTEMKQGLFSWLAEVLHRHTGVAPEDINLCIQGGPARKLVRRAIAGPAGCYPVSCAG